MNVDTNPRVELVEQTAVVEQPEQPQLNELVNIHVADESDRFKILSLLESSGLLQFVPEACRAVGFENFWLVAEVEGVPAGALNIVFNQPVPFVAFVCELEAFQPFRVVEYLMLTVFHLFNYSPFVFLNFTADPPGCTVELMDPKFYQPIEGVQ